MEPDTFFNSSTTEEFNRMHELGDFIPLRIYFRYSPQPSTPTLFHFGD